MSGLGLEHVASEHSNRTRCACCGLADAMPSMLREDYSEVARWTTAEVLKEALCGPCWEWTRRVAAASRMRQILRGEA